MSVTPTAGIAAAWSAAKTSPNVQPAQFAGSGQKAQPRSEEPVEPKKTPPAPEGQGTKVDVQV
jgi:hypothetical protein